MPPVHLPYPEPPLGDGRIGLRRWLETDFDCIRQAGADPEIPKGTTVPSTFTTAEGLAFIHRQWGRAETGQACPRQSSRQGVTAPSGWCGSR
jgi:ribosomal-protein-alanine N-acetyltransferase